MNVVDSSAWLEYFGDGPNAPSFVKAIDDIDDLLVPTITLVEVFKRVARQRGDAEAFRAVAAMRQGKVVPLDAELAVTSARIGLETRLPLADAIVLATARVHDAVLWTQDSDFEGMPGVEYRKKV